MANNQSPLFSPTSESVPDSSYSTLSDDDATSESIDSGQQASKSYNSLFSKMPKYLLWELVRKNTPVLCCISVPRSISDMHIQSIVLADTSRECEWTKCARSVAAILQVWTGQRYPEHPQGCQEDLKLFNFLRHLRGVFNIASDQPQFLISAFIYLDRLRKNNHIVITSDNAIQLIAVSLLASMKMLADDCYPQQSLVAQEMGFDEMDLHIMEISFLKLLNYELNIPSKEYQTAHDLLMRHLPGRARRLERKSAPSPVHQNACMSVTKQALNTLAQTVRTGSLPDKALSIRVNPMTLKRGRLLSDS